MRQIEIEGYTADEILNLADEQFDAPCSRVSLLCFAPAPQKYSGVQD